VTSGPLQAIERLEHLAKLFDHACEHAQQDALALFELLDQAMALLDEVAPAIAAARGGGHEAAVLRAALHARQRYNAFASVIGYEVARLARELTRLSAGVEATDRYAPAPDISPLHRLDRVG
jgi:hypothetical protein